MTAMKQMCANEGCDNLVPAQIGPKKCRSCLIREENLRMELPEYHYDNEGHRVHDA